jgi:CheY-like chemotaxis protein
MSVAGEAGPLVLYVEDEALIQELGILALSDAGFTVSAYLSGVEAMTALNGQGPTIKALVTDIDLGRAPNGWEVARHARELCPGLPIVYVSGGSSHEWTSMGVPGSVLVAKPYAAGQLVVAVSNVMLGPAQPPAPGRESGP